MTGTATKIGHTKQTNGAANPREVAGGRGSGRDAGGRFAPGNKLGTGNPFARLGDGAGAGGTEAAPRTRNGASVASAPATRRERAGISVPPAPAARPYARQCHAVPSTVT